MIFHKYNGCGDNLILLDYTKDTDYSQLAASLCAKERYNTGGLTAAKTDLLEMIYYNKDGSRVPMCRNGIRCFARYANDRNRMNEQELDAGTLAGTRKTTVLAPLPFYYSADTGVPDGSPEETRAAQSYLIRNQGIEIGDEKVTITSLFLEAVHTVVFVGNSREGVWKKKGELICHHPLFKEKTNVNFAEVVNGQELTVRTCERGVGWTLACNTGCCASHTVAKETGKISADQIVVHLEQRDLMISGGDTIQMTGPTVHE